MQFACLSKALMDVYPICNSSKMSNLEEGSGRGPMSEQGIASTGMLGGG